MTDAQREIYQVIDGWWNKFGFGPSIDDIMGITGDKGRGNVHRVIKILCDTGICKRTKGRARSVRPSYLRVRDID